MSKIVVFGRGYRNRTYTKGVRGPCATTTPSPTDGIIIIQWGRKYKQIGGKQAICVNKRFDTSVKSPYNIYSIN